MQGNGAQFDAGFVFRLDSRMWRQDYRRSRPGPSCVFVRAKSECAGNLPGGRELLRKARVYVCKPDRLVMQASFKYNEECSC